MWRSMAVAGVIAWSASLAWSGVHAAGANGDAWDPKAAAAYLDSRADWWSTWPTAARDHGTFCVSCHTAMPYALGRTALRRLANQGDPGPVEKRLIDNVATRVRMWNDVAPYYPDQLRGLPKSSESRGTESILNALILANRDASAGRLSDDTRAAFDHMWALQMRTGDLSGAWAWLDFHYEPWESSRAPFFGAALAGLAVSLAPGDYAGSADLQPNLKLLREYVHRTFGPQPLFNKLMALWSATLLSDEERKAVVDAAIAAQREDGGWSTASLGDWKRLDGSALDVRSDGYATGLVVVALRQARVTGHDDAIARGMAWLKSNQVRGTGQWLASSLNKERDPASDPGKFMTDAATGLAALALAGK